MRKYRILVIDDFEPWLSVVSKSFVLDGFDVYTALTGAEGIALAEKHLPDVIILDFHLKGESAVEVCKRIRAEKTLQYIPIVIASNDDTIDQTAYFECGAVSFLVKSGDLRGISANVVNLIGHMERASGVIEKGDIRLDPDGFRVYRNRKLHAQITADQFNFWRYWWRIVRNS